MDNINYDQEIERQAHPENFDMQEEEFDREAPEWEDTQTKCPECKAGLLQRTAVADGHDDYHWMYKCPNCGQTIEE